MPISRNVINYYANTRGRQYVMLPGSLTSRIGRNIFFSIDVCHPSVSPVVNCYIDIVFHLANFYESPRSPADRYNSLACKSRSYGLTWAFRGGGKNGASKRRRRSWIAQKLSTRLLGFRPPLARQFVSFERVMASHSFLIVYRPAVRTWSYRLNIAGFPRTSLFRSDLALCFNFLGLHRQPDDVFAKTAETVSRSVQTWFYLSAHFSSVFSESALLIEIDHYLSWIMQR